jgi:phenylalanyl-tRNA synthetase beta chain
MLISRHWLQKFFDVPLPDAQALSDALTFHAFEIDGITKHGDDDVLDVKVTPNRGHDALSHRGIAKELAAILKLPFAHDPFDNSSDISKKTSDVSVTIEDPALCKRYIAGYIKNVQVGPSPAWLVRNLEAIGQRSINNVVDATNFVMFNTGQPLHAFDAGKLAQKEGKFHIVVRRARAGETLVALDQKQYPLAERMLVIADGNADVPVGIAGVKGGEPAGITKETRDIIVESANFDGVSVRKTAQALKLRTDASSRFEQVLSPELAAHGMEGMIEFIEHVTKGEIVGFADVYPEPQKERSVAVSLDEINRTLGTALTSAHVADAFTRLGFGYKEEGGKFEVQIPYERLDLVIPEDLVEEVGRIVGYDAVPATPLSKLSAAPEISKSFSASEAAREKLVQEGYSEVFTSVFAEQGERAVLNKVDSVRPYLRSTLLPGLQDALEKNKHNKDFLGLKEIKLFEIGTVWKGGKEEVYIGTITEKQKAAESALAADAQKPSGELPLSQTLRYKTFSKYPYIVRDVALWVPSATSEESVISLIQKEAGELAVKISLFDRFEKEGKVSLAFRIIFQSSQRTLTEEEANAAMEKVYAALRAQGFEIR